MKLSIPFQELALRDDFMFGAVMQDRENCRRLLELILEMPIRIIDAIEQRSIVNHPAQKGVRLDIYAEDENRTRYNVEMQLLRPPSIEKRSRYYHSQMDIHHLPKGADYSLLPDTFVIFICDFDPFGDGKYRYIVDTICDTTGKLFADGRHTVFLNTQGRNFAEVPEELAAFLKFVHAGQAGNEIDFHDDYVKHLQNCIRKIKTDKGMEVDYMTFEMKLNDVRREALEEGRAEGRAEARAEEQARLLAYERRHLSRALGRFGGISAETQLRIARETDIDTLAGWTDLALDSDSYEDFRSKIQ